MEPDLSVADVNVIGVEHEYRVLDRRGEPVDFRRLLPTLSVPGAGLDPGDPNAHHLPSGVLLTADGQEAEVATPPVSLAPGSTWRVSAWSQLAETELLRALPPGHAIEGFSTHLNIAVRGDVVAVAKRYARHFGQATMALTEHHDSPGLLVRPRRGRLELGIDFLEGEQLRAALTFSAGAARCCETATELPEPLGRRLRRATDRPGWFLDHSLLVHDLAAAREALRATWALVRETVSDDTDDDERTLVDRVVAGDVPIPMDAVSGSDDVHDVIVESPFAELSTSPYPVVALSWAAVAFRVGPDEHIVVPRRRLRGFLAHPDARPFELVRGPFDRSCVVPVEPRVRGPWWREHKAQLVGVAVGVASVLAVYAIRGR